MFLSLFQNNLVYNPQIIVNLQIFFLNRIEGYLKLWLICCYKHKEYYILVEIWVCTVDKVEDVAEMKNQTLYTAQFNPLDLPVRIRLYADSQKSAWAWDLTV